VDDARDIVDGHWTKIRQLSFGGTDVNDGDSASVVEAFTPTTFAS